MQPSPTSSQWRDLIARGDETGIRTAFAESHPNEIAAQLAELEPDEIWRLLRGAEPVDAAAALSHLPIERQAAIVAERGAEEVSAIVAALPADDRADLLKALPDEARPGLLASLPSGTRRETERLAGYPEDSVGALMSTEFVGLPEGLMVREALDLIRLEAPRKETIYEIFVIDAQLRLAGKVSLEDLILAAPIDPVSDLVDREVVSVAVDASPAEAARLVKAYDLLALPVVDREGRMLGVVTVDDVLDVEEVEATSDFHRMAPIGTLKGGLRDAGLTLLYRARVPWLLVLVFMNIFSGAGIAYFEETIEAVVALVFFLPLLIDSGGNAGSQSATLMVRALAVGDVRMRDWVRLLGKEFGVSISLGVTMAIAVMLIASIRAPEVLVPVGLTMVATVVFGSLIGMSLPFLLTRLKLDPATASAPLITSIADIGGVLIYFSIASWWLGEVVAAAAAAAGE